MNSSGENTETESYRIEIVAAELGCSESTVRRLAKRLGLRRYLTRRGRLFTHDDVLRMKAERAPPRRYRDRPEGTVTVGEVARKHGKTPDAIRKAIRRAERVIGRTLKVQVEVTDHGGRRVPVGFIRADDVCVLWDFLRAEGRDIVHPYKRSVGRRVKKKKSRGKDEQG